MMRCVCGVMFDSHKPEEIYEHRRHIYAAQAARHLANRRARPARTATAPKAMRYRGCRSRQTTRGNATEASVQHLNSFGI
jgi:hypothetical protein